MTGDRLSATPSCEDVVSAKSRNAGWCACCRHDTEFVEMGTWLRDTYLCARCGSIPRFRALNLVLDANMPDWVRRTIHESSPASDFVARHCAAYSCSHLFDGVPRGDARQGIRCEDLEQLTFADQTFDLFITQDVLEHVFRPELAIREITRVLKPGGAHVFTAPKHKGLRATRQRAAREQEGIVHLLEPQDHGNPIGDGRSLVTWDYGDDFELLLWKWSGQPTQTYVTRDRQLGLDGEYLEVFVTRKVNEL
jgi:SAM-dependent methyltransferase